MIQVYAHRGGRAYFPENTLLAFKHALALGVDYIDADVVTDKQGELIVYHDTNLNSDTTSYNNAFISNSIPIDMLTTTQLKQYNVGRLNPHSNYAKYFPDQKQCDTQIPTLKEVIKLVRSQSKTALQIELKCNTLNPNLLPLIQGLKNVEVQSFHWDLLEKIHKQNGSIKTSFLTAGQAQIDFELIVEKGGKIWGPFEMDVTHDLVKKAHANGLKVVPWGWPEKEGCLFNKSCLQNLIQWGVDGIITDCPKQLQSLIQFKSDTL